MAWWHETAWFGCLLAIMVLLASWGAVIAAVAALLGANRSQRRQDVEIQRAAQLPGLTAAYVPTTKPPQRP